MISWKFQKRINHNLPVGWVECDNHVPGGISSWMLVGPSPPQENKCSSTRSHNEKIVTNYDVFRERMKKWADEKLAVTFQFFLILVVNNGIAVCYL